MDEITTLTQIDYSSMFVSIFVVLIGLKAIISLVEWFCNKIGLETKWMRRKHEEHELLIKTVQGLSDLKKKHNDDNNECVKHDEEIKADLKKLTDLFIDKEIDDYRWEIINFATKISEGKPCNKDSYKHCFRTYKKYEKLLEDNGLENGEVEISMEIINEAYKEKMLNGF